MNPRWLLRMKRLAQHPPSESRVKLVFGVIAVCLAIFVIERVVGFPDWMNASTAGTPRVR